jgi:hypothetical protein
MDSPADAPGRGHARRLAHGGDAVDAQRGFRLLAGCECASIARMRFPFAIPRLRRLAALPLLALCAAAGSVEPPPAAASAPPSATLRGDVLALVGDAECDEQRQCHVVGVGAKPCGGPSGYVAWSDKRTDPNALRTAVEAHARAQAEEDKRRGLVSDCAVTPMPAAVCRPRAQDGKRVCQLGLGGTDSAI